MGKRVNLVLSNVMSIYWASVMYPPEASHLARKIDICLTIPGQYEMVWFKMLSCVAVEKRAGQARPGRLQ